MSDETIARLLGDALNAMNWAMLVAVTDGSPAAITFIADYLNDNDAVDEAISERVAKVLGGRRFPPDAP